MFKTFLHLSYTILSHFRYAHVRFLLHAACSLDKTTWLAAAPLLERDRENP
jgi:hypothetical protein